MVHAFPLQNLLHFLLVTEIVLNFFLIYVFLWRRNINIFKNNLKFHSIIIFSIKILVSSTDSYIMSKHGSIEYLTASTVKRMSFPPVVLRHLNRKAMFCTNWFCLFYLPPVKHELVSRKIIGSIQSGERKNTINLRAP